MTNASLIERILRRDRAVTLAGVALLCLLAWAYVLSGAGLGMAAWRMTSLSLSPHEVVASPMSGMAEMPGMAMPGTPSAWSVTAWLIIVAMWWAMMIAMMTPSAAPTVLLYGRVYRYAATRGETNWELPPTGVFAAGYLLIWLCFSIAAASLQSALVRAGLMSDLMMWSQSRWLSGGFLVAAGLYQVSPLKQLCLKQCRSPATFLARWWRPGRAGALRLGIFHGAYCVGCCWALMAVLFVGGVMNLIWIAALTLLVLLEKLGPRGLLLSKVIGAALIVWGGVILLA